MMRIKGGGLFLWMLLLVFPAAGEVPPDFRNVRWGMGRVAVMAAEKASPQPVAGPYLSYRLWLLGREVFLRYRFVENRLVEARYVFPVKDGEDVRRLSVLLEEKYGAPRSGEMGENSVTVSVWETAHTRIDMRLEAGGDGRIVYAGKEMLDWLQARTEQAMKEERARTLDLF